MPVFGKIVPFDEGGDNWGEWIEQLEQYFTANPEIVEAEQKRAILLSSCGSKTYRLIRNLVAPTKPGDKTFAEIVEIVQNHHHPKPSAIVQRFKFNSRCRQSGESIATFMSELRRLSEHCEYGGTLNDMLRDRLVCGVADEQMQRRLLQEAGLTYVKAMEIATAMESAAKNSVDLAAATATNSQPIHKFQDKPRKGQPQGHSSQSQTTTTACYRCKGKHQPADCPFKDSVCFHCERVGHISKACRGGKQDKKKPPNSQSQFYKKKGKRSKPHRAHRVDEEDESASDSSEHYPPYEAYGLHHVEVVTEDVGEVVTAPNMDHFGKSSGFPEVPPSTRVKERKSPVTLGRGLSETQSGVKDDETGPIYEIHRAGAHDSGVNGQDPYEVTLQVNGKSFRMEIDTGARVSVIGDRAYKYLCRPQKHSRGNRSASKVPELQTSNARLKTYTGEIIKVLGSIKVPVQYKGQSAMLPLLVIPGDGPCLLGRNWLKWIRLDWEKIFHVSAFYGESDRIKRFVSVKEVLDKHQEVFKEEIGTFKDIKAKIYMDPEAKPKFFKARPVPYAYLQKIEDELDRLENAGVIVPVQFSDWAAPYVPVLKGDDQVRICGDYKVTVNTAAKLDTYPIPKIEDLYDL